MTCSKPLFIVVSSRRTKVDDIFTQNVPQVLVAMFLPEVRKFFPSA